MSFNVDKSAGLKTSESGSFFDLSAVELFGVFGKYKKLLLLAPIGAAVLAALISFTLPEQYVATLKIAPSKNAGVFAWLLNNEQVILTVAEKEKLAERYDVHSKKETLQVLGKKLKIEVNAKDKDAVSIDVNFTDPDPVFAANLVNAIGKEMQSSLFSMRLLESSRTLYELEHRRKFAMDTQKKYEGELVNPEMNSRVNRISPADRFAITSLSFVQAEESARGSDASQLEQDAILRLQSQLLQIQQQLQSSGGSNEWKKDPEGLIAAINTLQQHSYWKALSAKLNSKIEQLKREQLDELKIIPAEVPDFSVTGQKRPVIILATYFVSLLLLAVLLIAREALAYSRKR